MASALLQRRERRTSMRESVRYTLRLLAIAVAITAVSFAVLHLSSRSEGIASASVSAQDLTPLKPCANTACNSACWVDGTHHHPGTVAMRTVRQPNSCPPGTGGCLASPCP